MVGKKNSRVAAGCTGPNSGICKCKALAYEGANSCGADESYLAEEWDSDIPKWHMIVKNLDNISKYI